MKNISDIYPNFIKEHTICPQWHSGVDPFLVLADERNKNREDIIDEYLTHYSVPLLTQPMIPQYRIMRKDPKLPIIYTNLTQGGTMTVYTLLPVTLTNSQNIQLAEQLGINNLHWVLLEYADYMNVRNNIMSQTVDNLEEVVLPENIWEQCVKTNVTPAEILDKPLIEKIALLRKVKADALPNTHPLAFPLKTILSTYPVLSSTTSENTEDLLRLFTVQAIMDYSICPLYVHKKNIILAVKERLDTPTKQTIKMQLSRTNVHFQCVLLPEVELQKLITQINVSITTRQIHTHGNFGYTDEEDVEYEQYKIEPGDVRKVITAGEIINAQTFLDSLLMQAIQENASDIHLSIRNRGLRARLRVNGILKDILDKPLSLDLSRQIMARVQVLAGIDTQHKDLPQDGQFKFKLRDLPCEVRVNSSENINGLHIVMRLQVPNASLQNLETLGIDPFELRVIRESLEADNGMMIICGPTGSGKSTTLYAALKEIDRVRYKVLTGEQPVECRIPNVEQTNIIKGSPYTFSEFTIAAMRQDPDYILIGETRDADTAKEIVRAAITGHVVLTTLHTNTAALAPARLIDLTHEPYLLADALTALCAQRLLPKLCPYCMEKVDIPTATQLKEHRIKEEWLMGAQHFYRSRGCAHCNHTGRINRVCIMEAFLITQEIREMIARQAPAREIVRAQCATGSQQLYEKAIRRVARGEVALDDALPLKLTCID